MSVNNAVKCSNSLWVTLSVQSRKGEDTLGVFYASREAARVRKAGGCVREAGAHTFAAVGGA